MPARSSFIAVLSLAVTTMAGAQQKPSTLVACTIQADVCVRASRSTNSTSVERANGTRHPEVLWSVAEWLNVVRVSSSGSSFLVEANRSNLLPPDADASLVVLRLYSNSGSVREFRAGEFLRNSAEIQLGRKVGAWGQRQGSDDDDIARYLLVTGQIVRISLVTGEVLW